MQYVDPFGGNVTQVQPAQVIGPSPVVGPAPAPGIVQGVMGPQPTTPSPPAPILQGPYSPPPVIYNSPQPLTPPPPAPVLSGPYSTPTSAAAAQQQHEQIWGAGQSVFVPPAPPPPTTAPTGIVASAMGATPAAPAPAPAPAPEPEPFVPGDLQNETKGARPMQSSGPVAGRTTQIGGQAGFRTSGAQPGDTGTQVEPPKPAPLQATNRLASMRDQGIIAGRI